MEDEQVKHIVENFRQEIYPIDDEGVTEVLEFCKRKMEISKKPENYLYLLLQDELKNYCVRLAVNITGIQNLMERRCLECALCV